MSTGKMTELYQFNNEYILEFILRIVKIFIILYLSSGVDLLKMFTYNK